MHMSGAEHYTEAQRLLEQAEEARPENQSYLVQLANTHAVLALAAATALQPGMGDDPTPDWYAWYSAAAVKPAVE